MALSLALQQTEASHLSTPPGAKNCFIINCCDLQMMLSVGSPCYLYKVTGTEGHHRTTNPANICACHSETSITLSLLEQHHMQHDDQAKHEQLPSPLTTTTQHSLQLSDCPLLQLETLLQRILPLQSDAWLPLELQLSLSLGLSAQPQQQQQPCSLACNISPIPQGDQAVKPA